MLDAKQLGKRIAFMRKQNGMSQEKLAELLCISPQAISKWENGHTMPEISLLPVLAQIFECSIDEIIMPAYLFDPDIEEKKPAKIDLQTQHIVSYIMRHLGNMTHKEDLGLDDAAVIDTIRKVYPNLGNFQIKRERTEVHNRYICSYITVTTPQQELKLVEKVYKDDDKELLGYELFSRNVTAIPQIYCIDFHKKVLLMEDVSDCIQGSCFDENSESGKKFREHYHVLLEETAKMHAAFWQNKDAFQKAGVDWRHETAENLLVHINGMEQDFLAYRKKEEEGKIPKVWNGLRNTISAEKLDYFREAIQFLRKRYLPLIDERFRTGKHITVIHGDLHPGNIFYRDSSDVSVKVIDMEAVRVGLCTEDLSMLLALHIEQDKERSKPLLDCYYDCLCRDVGGYSYERFMDDYRISIAEAMFYPIRLINQDIYDFAMRDRAIRAYEAFVAGNTF